MKKLLLFLITILIIAACGKDDDNPNPNGSGNTRYSVTYTGNGNTGGSLPVDGNTYENGQSAEVLGNTGNLRKVDYSFAGWSTKADGTGTQYLPGSKLTINGANVILYARWLANSSGTTFNITYYGNGNTSGSAPVDNNSYSPGALATIKSNSGGLSKNGSTFSSWNTSPSGSGQTYQSGSQVSIVNDLALYAIYNTSSSGSGKFYGFNASGQMKRKTTSTSSWVNEDLSSTFGSSSLVSVVWDGSRYVGFNASGQTKRKTTTTSSWITEDLSNTFGSSNLVCVVWDGSRYIGFNASGQVKRKSTLTSAWINEDLSNTFGTSSLVSVVWDGSKFYGFNASGQVKRKSTLTSAWVNEDLSSSFGTSSLVSVVWDGT
ncbi:MAG: InlB B-repeat-containing protein [Hymenobacteraceae bacterium]|nr:InlB B-repeat-containing protein [Hymenobacteraceae bacterium]